MESGDERGGGGEGTLLNSCMDGVRRWRAGGQEGVCECTQRASGEAEEAKR